MSVFTEEEQQRFNRASHQVMEAWRDRERGLMELLADSPENITESITPDQELHLPIPARWRQEARASWRRGCLMAKNKGKLTEEQVQQVVGAMEEELEELRQEVRREERARYMGEGARQVLKALHRIEALSPHIKRTVGDWLAVTEVHGQTLIIHGVRIYPPEVPDGEG